jgi:hypothetical protein
VRAKCPSCRRRTPKSGIKARTRCIQGRVYGQAWPRRPKVRGSAEVRACEWRLGQSLVMVAMRGIGSLRTLPEPRDCSAALLQSCRPPLVPGVGEGSRRLGRQIGEAWEQPAHRGSPAPVRQLEGRGVARHAPTIRLFPLGGLLLVFRLQAFQGHSGDAPDREMLATRNAPGGSALESGLTQMGAHPQQSWGGDPTEKPYRRTS